MNQSHVHIFIGPRIYYLVIAIVHLPSPSLSNTLKLSEISVRKHKCLVNGVDFGVSHAIRERERERERERSIIR